MFQDWWKSWSREYLQTLQERYKWKTELLNIQLNDLVLITNELSPPADWPVARVIELHKGSDGLVRVVTLKTSSSTYKIPIH